MEKNNTKMLPEPALSRIAAMIFAAALLFGFCALSFVPASASAAADSAVPANANGDADDSIEALPEDLERARSVCLYNIDSGTVLYSQNADDVVAPSSTARIMAALLFLEKFPDLDINVTVSKAAVRKARLTDCNKLGLISGEMVSVKTLMNAFVMYGAHDAAYVLAENSFGSSKKCVTEMNKRARELGMDSTRYINITGEFEEGAFTTASDVAKLALYAFENPRYTEIARRSYVSVAKLGRGGFYDIYSQNYLQSKRTLTDYYNPNVNGMNAAGIDRVDRNHSGFCCVATASIENLNYLCIVMDAQNKKPDGSVWYYAYSIASDLFDWAENNFAFRSILSASVILGEIKVSLATDSDYVSVIPAKNLEAFLPRNKPMDELVDINVTIFEDELLAPVAEGLVVGRVVVSMNDEIVCETDLVTKNALNLSKWQAYRAKVVTFAATKTFKWIAAAVVAFVLVTVLVTARIKYIRKNRIHVHVRGE